MQHLLERAIFIGSFGFRLPNEQWERIRFLNKPSIDRRKTFEFLFTLFLQEICINYAKNLQFRSTIG